MTSVKLLFFCLVFAAAWAGWTFLAGELHLNHGEVLPASSSCVNSTKAAAGLATVFTRPSCLLNLSGVGVRFSSRCNITNFERVHETSINVVPSFNGRIGNNLFQLAAAYAIARNLSTHSDRSVCLSVSERLLGRNYLGRFLRAFHVRPPLSDRPNVTVHFRAFDHDSSGLQAQFKALSAPTQVLTSGYAASSHLFDAFKEELRLLLGPPPEVGEYLAFKYPSLSRGICYHVRGGDKWRKPRYPQLRDPYYRAAFEIVTAALHPDVIGSRSHFLATDDESAAMNVSFFGNASLEGRRLTTIREGPVVTLWALSLCGGGIVTASSTFSWWAAYLRANLTTAVVMPRSLLVASEPPFPGGYFPSDAAVLLANGSLATPHLQEDPSVPSMRESRVLEVRDFSPKTQHTSLRPVRHWRQQLSTTRQKGMAVDGGAAS